MGRPNKEIKAIPCNRLKQILDETGLSQKQLQEATGISQQTISLMVNCKANVTENTAEVITGLFPQYRFEWLMGFDDCKTAADMYVSLINSLDHTDKIVCALAELAGYKVDDVRNLGLDKDLGKDAMLNGLHYRIRPIGKTDEEEDFISVDEWTLLKEEIYEIIGLKLKYTLKNKKVAYDYPLCTELPEVVVSDSNKTSKEDYSG